MPENADILLFAASSINLEKIGLELTAIQDALQEAYNKNQVDLLQKNAITYNGLESSLRNHPQAYRITMLHYAGHADPKGILTKLPDGTVTVVGINSLQWLVEFHKAFRFIFLNGCCSQQLANAFISAGVPMVIGTTTNIKDRDAHLMAAQFYQQLAKKNSTIPDAFRATNDHFFNRANTAPFTQTHLFEEYTTDLAPGDVYRTFKTKNNNNAPDAKYPWVLYLRKDVADTWEKQKAGQQCTPEEEQLLARTVYWTLAPQYKPKLSLNGNSACKQRIFCLYSLQSAPYYEAFKNLFSLPNPKERIIHGVQELFPDQHFDKTTFLQELAAAHMVIHFPEGPEYLAADFMNIAGAEIDQAPVKHVMLPLTSLITGPFRPWNWYKQADELVQSNSSQGIGAGFAGMEHELGKKKKQEAINAVMNFYSDSFHQIVAAHFNTADQDILSTQLKNMLFTPESTTIDNTISLNADKHLFFAQIEGTTNCAQRLIVQRLRTALGMDIDTHSMRIIFGNNATAATASGFWDCLRHEMDPLKGSFKTADRDKCIQGLVDKLWRGHVSLVVEGITAESEDLYRTEIQPLWEKIVLKYRAERSVRDENNFLLATVSYSGNIKPLPAANNYNEVVNIKLAPVSLISLVEWRNWHKMLIACFKHLQLSYKNDYFRRIAMEDICNDLKAETNIIDETVLIYD